MSGGISINYQEPQLSFKLSPQADVEVEVYNFHLFAIKKFCRQKFLFLSSKKNFVVKTSLRELGVSKVQNLKYFVVILNLFSPLCHFAKN